MVTADFSFIQQLPEDTAPFQASDIEHFSSRYMEYRASLLSRKQGFLELHEDTQTVEMIQEFVAANKRYFEHIVILGIGGSMLGTQMLLHCFASQSGVRFHTLDNIDPVDIEQLDEQLNLSKTLFLVQTKSGGTPETLSQYFYYRQQIEAAGLNPLNHFVLVTDPESGYLREVAKQEPFQTFAIPENVGGRFSVLTAVGLLAAEFAEIDIQGLLRGAELAISQHFAPETVSSAYQLAVAQYLGLGKNIPITVFMSYSSQLRLLANWYTQLLSESIGKAQNRSGNQVNVGITPVPALGVSDQHAQLQLFQEGPRDKLILFVKPKDYGTQVSFPENIAEQFSYLRGKSFNQLIDAEFSATRESLTESGVPSITLEVPLITPESIGELLVFLELSVAFLGELLEINAFDQPGVERSKVLTRKFLSEQ